MIKIFLCGPADKGVPDADGLFKIGREQRFHFPGTAFLQGITERFQERAVLATSALNMDRI